MKDGNHSQRNEPPPWLYLILIALITFGVAVTLGAMCLPSPSTP